MAVRCNATYCGVQYCISDPWYFHHGMDRMVYPVTRIQEMNTNQTQTGDSNMSDTFEQASEQELNHLSNLWHQNKTVDTDLNVV